MTGANLYEEMVKKFAGKSVTFEFAPGQYTSGTVLDVYKGDPSILIIMDQFGSEIEVDFSNRDVVVQ